MFWQGSVPNLAVLRPGRAARETALAAPGLGTTTNLARHRSPTRCQLVAHGASDEVARRVSALARGYVWGTALRHAACPFAGSGKP